MALSNAEKQKRFYEKRIKSGGVKRYEFRISDADEQFKIDYLAEHWGCSRTEAFIRCVNEAWEKEGKPVPGYTDNKPKKRKRR